MSFTRFADIPRSILYLKSKLKLKSVQRSYQRNNTFSPIDFVNLLLPIFYFLYMERQLYNFFWSSILYKDKVTFSEDIKHIQ